MQTRRDALCCWADALPGIVYHHPCIPAPTVEPPKAIPLQLCRLLTHSASRRNTERMSPTPKHVQWSSREAAELLFGHHQGDAEG